MNTRTCLSLLLAAGLGAASPQAAQFRFPVGTLTVPDGFEVELVAGPPLVDRPMMAEFDEQGRLYVADSSGSNEPVQKQLEKKPHRIVRLEDSDGDGKFDRSVVFADQLMFPEGVLWHEGAVYTGAPPSIWKLQDTDGDGVADQRSEWFQGKTLTGCANDLHGPYLGPDGWIYWCKGAFARQTYERPGLPTISDNAAHVFRCRPDGTGIDSVMSGGMDNPVEVAWSREGELFFITTFFHHPEAGKRDAIVHCIYGGAYPKMHSAIDDVKRTGELLPSLVELGPAAACALTCYDASAFGPDYAGNLFSTEFNLRRVARHVIEPDGATYRASNQDFLVADNPDFHPTDVFEDADGSLLVIDTGGWYKICCPTSQLPKPDVLGAIYRIRKIGAPRLEDPRGLKIPWATQGAAATASLLEDPRPFVRRRAVAELGKAKDTAALLRALQSKSVDMRRNAVWALTRIEGSAARAAVRSALTDADEGVRRTAIHSVAMHRDGEAEGRVLERLRSSSLFESRKAAEALGRIGKPEAIPALLEVAATFRNRLNMTAPSASERILEHAYIYALIEIASPTPLLQALEREDPAVQRAALIALDQLTGSPLQPEQVIRFLRSPNPLLKQTADWIVAHRPAWGSSLAAFYRSRIMDGTLSEADRSEQVNQLGVLSRDPAVQGLLTECLLSRSAPTATRLDALRAIAKAGLKEPPPPWLAALSGALRSPEDPVRAQAVATARTVNFPKQGVADVVEALLQTASEPVRPSALRLEALAAIPGGLPTIPTPVFTFLLQELGPTNPVVTRSLAATVLSRSKLNADQSLAMAAAIQQAGPMELTKLLTPFEGTTNEAVGLRLVESLKANPAVSSLTPDVVKRLVAAFPDSVKARSGEVQKLLNIDVTAMNARLESFLQQMQGGDIRRGQLVFNSQKAACFSCHTMGYVGGRVGPDLTSIGQIRTERDLLESILYPSASFVRSYEPMIVVTKDGEDYSGVVRKDAADELVLSTGPDAEQRIPRDMIAESRPGTVSTMPAGLEELLTRQELVDLVTFLKNTKWGAQ